MREKQESLVKGTALAVLMVLVIISSSFVSAERTGDAEHSTPAPKAWPYGGVFKIGFQSDLKSLNPCVASDVWSWNVIGLVYDTLARTSKDTMEPIPWVAENWSEDTPDHLNWTVKIRQGVKWHDGMPVTADDVVFTYNFFSVINRPHPWCDCIDWTPISGAADPNETYFEGVKKVDAYTVKFKLRSPCADFLNDVLGIPLLPKHIWRNHWNDATLWNMDYNPVTGEANVIGCGPYKFKYWKQGVEARIERNADYFMNVTLEDGNSYRAPFVDAVQFIIYKNMDAMVTALKQGTIDYIWWNIDPGWVPILLQIPGTRLFTNPDPGYQYVGFNLMLPFEGYDNGTGYQPRDDESEPVTYPSPEAGNDAGLPFRKAVSHCIDKDYIVSQLLQGYGTKGDSIVPPGLAYWYNDSLPQYPYNLTLAEQLLDEAHYSDVNSDGWREDYKGRVMDGPNNDGQIDILTPPCYDYPPWYEAGKIIASAMKQVGIKAETVPTNFGEIVDDVFVNRTFEMYVLGWILSMEPTWVYDFFNSKFDWYNPNIGDGGNNCVAYRNQHYDEISARVNTEMDREVRRELVKECQGMIARDLPVNVLYYRQVLEVADVWEWTGYHEHIGGIGNGWTLLQIHHPIYNFFVDVKAFPATIQGTKNATLQLFVSVTDNNGSACSGLNVSIVLQPAQELASIELDAAEKVTDENGKAVFTITCRENFLHDVVFRAIANVTDGTHNAWGMTCFTITMAGLNVEVTSPTIVEGLNGTVFYLNVTVKQFNTPLSGAQVEFQTLTPSDNLKNTLVRTNTDANGTAGLSFKVLANFTASTPVELKFTVWPAGGVKTLYSHNFVVLARGGSVVDVAIDPIDTIKGVPGKTTNVTVHVSNGTQQIAGASVYGYVSPADKGLVVVQTGAIDTGTDGKAIFTLKVGNLIMQDTTFKFIAVVASGLFAGYATTPVNVSAVKALNASVEVNPATIPGEVGKNTTVKVTVISEGTPAEGASVWLDILPATGALAVSPANATTDASGVVQFRISVNATITNATTFTITARVSYGTLFTTGTACLQVNSIPSVELELSKTEVAGITGARIVATVTVQNGTTPIADVNVSLALNQSTGLHVETGKKTGSDGKATINITVTQNFSADAVVSVEAVATIGGRTYQSSVQTLAIKHVPYAITVTLDRTSVDGYKDTVVNAIVSVLNGTTPMYGANVSLHATPDTGIEIAPGNVTTDANGTAGFSIKLTAHFTANATVSIVAETTIDGVEYTGVATTLSIMGIQLSYNVTMTLESTQIDGVKGNTVKATIIVRSGDTPVPNLSVTVTFDRSGLRATNATTDANGTAVVTITVIENFTADTVIKVTPVVAGKPYPDSAVNLAVREKATTPGFEVIAVVSAIALGAGGIAYSRRRVH